MGHRQRWYVTDMVYEVTIRTLFGQFWLRPDPACRAIINGVFGKARSAGAPIGCDPVRGEPLPTLGAAHDARRRQRGDLGRR